MKTYKIRPRGKHCYIRPLSTTRALKIFDAYPVQDFSDLESFRWGDLPAKGMPNISSLLTEATIIQNYMSLEGLAPRVYDIVAVEQGQARFYAQEVELVHNSIAETQEEANNVYRKVKSLGSKYGFTNEKEDVSVYDVLYGQLVDFNTFHFTRDHKERIAELYKKYALYGKTYYHAVPELDITGGPRNNQARVEYMQLDKVDFKDKDVVDFGCAGGFFTREAKRRGANKVTGFDLEGEGGGNPVLASKIASNELKFWDIDYYNEDLSRKLFDYSDIKADITFFLSMNFHIGIPDFVRFCTKELCIFEDNSKDRNAKEQLDKMFSKVELVGHAKDHGDKPIYHCFV